MDQSFDVVVLGSGIAGLSGALAAHEMGLKAVVLEKASLLGGGTVNSYGLIWIGQNHLGEAAGHHDNRDDVIAYTGEIASLRRFKDDVAEVKAGLECGVTFTQNFTDLKPGDFLETFEVEERERTL